MPSFTRKIQVPGKSSQELYDKVAGDVDRFLEKSSVGKAEVVRDPSAKSVQIKSSMVTATLTCGEGSIDVDAKLSLLASPFRGKIDEGIDRWIAKAFNMTKPA